MSIKAELDQIAEQIDELLHTQLDPMVREHLNYALALVVEAGIAENGSRVRRPIEIVEEVHRQKVLFSHINTSSAR